MSDMKSIMENWRRLKEDCWDGYRRVPGSKQGAPGSCVKKEEVRDTYNDEVEKRNDRSRRRGKAALLKTEEAQHVSPAKALKDEGGAIGFSKWEELTGMSKKQLEKYVASNKNLRILRDGDIANLAESEDIFESECVVSEASICAAGKNYVDGKTIGGQTVSRGADGKFNNWSARAAQIASKYCKDPNYGKGRGRDAKNESIEEADSSDGGLRRWAKEEWTHSDGTPCGGGKADGSNSRCKPKKAWGKLSAAQKKADNEKKRRGTEAGQQYVASNHPVTKADKKRVSEGFNSMRVTRKQIEQMIIEEIEEILGMREAKDSMPCNKPKRTPNHPKKSHMVIACQGGKKKTIRFGQQGVKTNQTAGQRKAFKSRHGKNIAKGKMSAAYWANKVKWSPSKTKSPSKKWVKGS